MFKWGEKNKEKNMTLFDIPNNPNFSNSYEIFIEYFYKNPVVNSVINLIVNTVNTKNIILNEKIDQYNIINFLNNNIQPILLDLLITGNCFIIKESNLLHILRNKHISIATDDQQINVISYKDLINQKKIPKENVLHLKLNNPKHRILGVTPLMSLQLTIETHNSISNYMYKFIENGGRPSGIISYKDIISPSQKEGIRRELLSMHSKIGKEGSIGVLEGEFSWQQIGSSPKDINIIEIKQDLEKTICHSLGIPPILLGIIDAKFNNYNEAIKYFHENTINFYTNLVISNINNFLNINLSIIDNIIDDKNNKSQDILNNNDNNEVL